MVVEEVAGSTLIVVAMNSRADELADAAASCHAVPASDANAYLEWMSLTERAQKVAARLVEARFLNGVVQNCGDWNVS